MKVRKSRVLIRIAAIASAFAMIAGSGFVLLHGQPARAAASYFFLNAGVNHGTQTAFSPGQREFDVTVTDDAGSMVPAATTVYMKVEGGANDTKSDTDGGASPDWFKVPDAQCVVPAGQQGCVILFTFGSPTGLNTASQARFWIKGRMIDDVETWNAGSSTSKTPQPNQGCVDNTASVNDTHADGTDVFGYVVYNGTGSFTTGPDPTNVYTGGAGTPVVCSTATSWVNDGTAVTDDRIGGSPPPPTNTGTPTPTGSTTGTPTPTTGDTGTPTPTTSDTGNPSPTNTGNGGPAALTLDVSPRRGVYGTDFLVSGGVACNGVKVANAKVSIYRHTVGSPKLDRIDTTSDVQGRYAVRDTDLAASADYSGAWTGNAACPSGAETGSSQVRAIVYPGISAGARDDTLRKGETASISGRVIPAHPGKKVMLEIFRGNQKKWDFVAEKKLGSKSEYGFLYRAGGYKGFLLFRVVYVTQDLDHGWNISREVKVTWS